MFELISKLFFRVCTSWQSITQMISCQTNAIVMAYPNQAFRIFWMYNYYYVIINEFLKKHDFQVFRTHSFSLPIENEFFARFSYYETDSANYHLYFEHSKTRLPDCQSNMMHLYKTPEYILCGRTLPEDVQLAPVRSNAKFINVIWKAMSSQHTIAFVRQREVAMFNIIQQLVRVCVGSLKRHTDTNGKR